MSPKKGTSKKPILDLALELGVRTDAILQSMRDMGLKADESTSLDSDQESVLIDHMIESGAVTTNLVKGKGRRKLSSEPVVDDNLLLEALGAGESGFSNANIPRQIQFESGFEKKSLWQKWFGKKKDIAASLQENPLTEEAVESMFAAPIALGGDREISPFREIEIHEAPPPETDAGKSEKKVALKKEPAPAPIAETLEEMAAEELSAEDLEGIEDLEIDEDLLGNMDEIDVGGEEGLEDIAAEDLEDLGEMPSEEMEGIGFEDLETESLDEGEDLDASLDEEDLKDLSEEGLEGGEGAEEEEYEPGYIEKIFARIHLTPAEMWALMIGAVSTMLVLLGITIYWWIYQSPRAMNNLLDEANTAYYRAIGTSDREGELDEWRRGRVLWKKPRASLQEAADLYAEYIRKFPHELENLKHSYKNMCDSYYQIALGDKETGNKEQSENAFRQMATFYEKFLELQEQIAELNIGANQPQLAYPMVEDQRLALFRISLAKRELQQFDQTIKNLQDFVSRFRDSDQALEAMIEIGNSYQEWAKSKKDEELSLLGSAINSYRDALEKTAATDFRRRMQLFSKIGDVQYRLYERSNENGKNDEANQYLSEVIANYVNSVSDAERIDLEPMQPMMRRSVMGEIQQVKKQLGDLYLIRGSEAGKAWREFEETAEPFPDSIVHKQKLLEGAQREQETARHFLGQANRLYDSLLAQSDLLGASDYHEIMYNKANAFYIMREYPKAIAAGQQILTTTRELSPSTRTKILYLLGNTAWENAKETGDYTLVKEFYYQALEQDPFFPPEQKGDMSHLADIRLINAYYLSGENKNYPEAIKRFEGMVNRYPESGYTYMTLYFYAKTLQEYGDFIYDQMEKLREEAKNSTNADSLLAQARSLQDQSRKQYDLAVTQYTKAIAARENSTYVDTQQERFLQYIMFNLGHSAFMGGKYQDAERYYKTALDRFRNDTTASHFKPLAIERLGDLNARLSSYDQSISYYKQYLDNAYENPDMRITMKLADAYLNRFSWKEAREWYKKIIANDPLVPTDAQVEKRLRMGLAIQKGPGFEALKKIAESYLREALTYSMESREAKMEDALEAYSVLAQRYPLGLDKSLPADSDSLRTIGLIQYELGKYADAVKSYDEFLKQEPNFPRKGQILYKIGQAYMNLANYDMAIDRLSQITQESLDNTLQYADALILLGQAYQNKANEFMQSGDEGLYTRFLERAQRTYNRVSITNEPQKIREAITMSAAIDSIIRSRAELSPSNAP